MKPNTCEREVQAKPQKRIMRLGTLNLFCLRRRLAKQKLLLGLAKKLLPFCLGEARKGELCAELSRCERRRRFIYFAQGRWQPPVMLLCLKPALKKAGKPA